MAGFDLTKYIMGKTDTDAQRERDEALRAARKAAESAYTAKQFERQLATTERILLPYTQMEKRNEAEKNMRNAAGIREEYAKVQEKKMARKWRDIVTNHADEMQEYVLGVASDARNGGLSYSQMQYLRELMTPQSEWDALSDEEKAAMGSFDVTRWAREWNNEYKRVTGIDKSGYVNPLLDAAMEAVNQEQARMEGMTAEEYLKKTLDEYKKTSGVYGPVTDEMREDATRRYMREVEQQIGKQGRESYEPMAIPTTTSSFREKVMNMLANHGVAAYERGNTAPIYRLQDNIVSVNPMNDNVPLTVQLVSQMRDDEWNTMLHLYETDEDAAVAYLDMKYDELQERRREDTLTSIQKLAETPGVGSALSSVIRAGASIEGAVDTGYRLATALGKTVADTVADRTTAYDPGLGSRYSAALAFQNNFKLNKYGDAYTAGQAAANLRAADAERVGELAASAGRALNNSAFGKLVGAKQTAGATMPEQSEGLWEKTEDGKNRFLGITEAAKQATGKTGIDFEAGFKKAGVQVYNTFMSAVVDSTLNSAIMGNAGFLLQGSGAMVDATSEILEKGGSEEQALAMGFIVGGLAAGTEKLHHSNIEGIFKHVPGKLARKMIINAMGEAVEEGVEEIGGILADYYIMAEKGEWRAKYKERTKTMSESQAAKETIMEMVGSVGESALWGAVGSVMGAGVGGMRRVYAHTAYKAAYEDINKASERYGKETAAVFKNTYDPGLMPGVYTELFDTFYEAGRVNDNWRDVKRIAGDMLEVMGEDDAFQAYKAGRMDQNRIDNGKMTEQEARPQTKQTAENKGETAPTQPAPQTATASGEPETAQAAARTGTISEEMTDARVDELIAHYEGTEGERTKSNVKAAEIKNMPTVAGRTEEERMTAPIHGGVVKNFTGTLDRRTTLQVRVLDVIGKRHNVEYEIVDHIEGNANGVYAGGHRFVVSLETPGKAILQSGLHESGHYIKANDPEGFTMLEEFVRYALEKRGENFDEIWQKRQQSYAANGVTLDDDGAREEIVCESLGTVFSSEEAVREFFGDDFRARTVVGRLADALHRFIASVKSAIEEYAGRNNRREIAALWGQTEDLVQLARMLDNALGRAGENYRATEETGTRQGENVTSQPAAQTAAVKGEPDVFENFDEVEGTEEGDEYPEELSRKLDDLYERGEISREEANDLYDQLDPGATNEDIKAAVRDIKDPTRRELAEKNVTLSADGETAYMDPKYSLNSLPMSGLVAKNRKELEDVARLLSEQTKLDYNQCLRYVKNINSVAAYIAANRDRLDFDPETGFDAMKDNSEYKFTIDFSTLCAKRLLFTGTFDKVQHMLGSDVVLDENDVIALRNMMKDAGLVVPCGFCYVEASRKSNGPIIRDFIAKYNAAVDGDGKVRIGDPSKKGYKEKDVEKGGFKFKLEDLTTSDGYVRTMKEHPEAFEVFKAVMNHRGQQKPKLIETETDYRNDILNEFKRKDSVDAMNKNGGLRVQSFSDFLTIHLLDMMQVVTDMSRVGLMSQAYTKVPEFAKLLGRTGMKINLSIVSAGVDERGRLLYDDVEGMPHEEAFNIRKRFSKNVGTIIVVGSDAELRAAMKDPRIDFIIPFHKSQWSEANEKQLGLGRYKDYTDYQNERYKDTGKRVNKNDVIYPKDYWVENLDGDGNARKYLALCEEKGFIPKFDEFKNEPGYWKTLIDFKMYDNEGNFAPQEVVRPIFSMREIMRQLRQYDGDYGLKANDKVAEQFVEKKREDMAKAAEAPDLSKVKQKSKFSLNEKVERVGDLVAVHELDKKKMVGVLRENGFMMPSIGVVNANDANTGYGEGSVVFYSSAIDPNARTENKVYGGDAWTAMHPRTVDSDAVVYDEIYSEMYGSINSDVLYRAAPLGDIGLYKNKMYDAVYTLNTDLYYAKNNPDMIDRVLQDYREDPEKLRPFKYYLYGKDNREKQGEAFRMFYEDANEIDIAIDDEAALNLIEDILKRGAAQEAIIEDTGEPATEENILRGMRSLPEIDSYGNEEYEAIVAARHEMRNIDEIHSEADRRLKRVSEKEHQDEMSKGAYEQTQIINTIKDDLEESGEYKGSSDLYKELLYMARHTKTADDVYNYMLSHGMGVSRETADKIQTFLENTENLHVTYFEAKPRRNIGFDEVAAVVVPDSWGEYGTDVIQQMRDAGLNVITYKEDDTESRKAALNSVQQPGVRFSLNEGETPGAAVTEEQVDALEKSLSEAEKEQLRKKAETAAYRRLRDRDRATFDRIAVAVRTARDAGDTAGVRRAMAQYREALNNRSTEDLGSEISKTYRQYLRDRLNVRDRAKAYERAEKGLNALKNMLAKPDKKKHVPLELQPMIASMLENINLTRTGKNNASARIWKAQIKAIADHIAEQLDRQNSGDYDGEWMTLSRDQVDALKEAVEIVNESSGKSFTDMTIEELNAFSGAVAMINHQINSIDQMWMNKRYSSVDALGDQTISDLDKMKTNRIQDTAAGGVDTFLNVQNLDAGSFFERLGGENGAAYSVYQELADGMIRGFAMAREMSEKVPAILGLTGKDRSKRIKELREWGNDERVIKLRTKERGKWTVKDVTVTTMNLMELYEHSKREQSMKHVLTGGASFEKPNGKLAGDNVYKFTAEDVQAITSMLTDEQKKLADRMMDFLSNDVAQKGNEVSYKLYLFRNFTEKHYWRIYTDSRFRRQKEQDGTVLYNAITNMGMSKAVQEKVSNPLVIGNALNTFTDHIAEMCAYYGMAAPMDDFLRWYNYAGKDESGLNEYQESVKKEIKRTIGNAGTKYIQKLMDDINGNRVSETDPTGWVGKMLRNYKVAAIAAKWSVVIQQPTAVLRASAVINPKYLRGAFNGIGAKTIQEMQEHSALAWWKSNGNYEIGTGKSMKAILTGMQDTTFDTMMDRVGAAAGKADDLGWAVIWQAVKSETKAEHKELEYGTEAYWEHVSRRAEEIWLKTQVVDTILTRSDIMRSKDSFAKASSAFMSESTKNVNLVRNAIGEIARAWNEKDGAAKRKAAVKLTRSVAAIAAAQALNSVMKALWNAFKYYDPEDEDEEGNPVTRFDMFLENWQEDMRSGMNPLENIPIIKDIWELVGSAIKGETVNGIERMDMAAITKLLSAAGRLANYTGGNKSGYSTWAAVKPLITSVSDAFGLPVSGLVANTEMLLNILSPGSMRTYQLERNKGAAEQLLYDALAEGKNEEAQRRWANLEKGQFGQTPMSPEDIKKAMARIMATTDERIAQMYEASQDIDGGDEQTRLKKELEKEGWESKIVEWALEKYPTLMKADAKSAMLKAQEDGDEEAVARYRQILSDFGVKDETIEGYLNGKDMDADLEEPNSTYLDLYRMMRANQKDEAARIRENLLDQGKTDKDIDTAIAKLMAEYDPLVAQAYKAHQDIDGGSEETRLINKIMAEGVSKETAQEAVYQYPSVMKANAKKAMLEANEKGNKKEVEQQKQILRDFGVEEETIEGYLKGKTDEELEARNAKYADLYRMIRAGETATAEDMRANLIDQGKSREEISKGIADQLALYDDRIQKMWETRAGGEATDLKPIKKAMEKEGYTEEEINQAINRYPSIVTTESKSEYIAAYEAGDKEAMKAIEKRLTSLGKKKETWEDWVSGKDLEKELEGVDKFYQDNLAAAIRNSRSDTADVKEMLKALIDQSEAADPAKSVASAMASELKSEYCALAKKGSTQAMQKMKTKLMAAGVSEDTIDGWTEMKYGKMAGEDFADGATTIKEHVHNMIEKNPANAAEEFKQWIADGTDKSNLVTQINNAYKEEYLALRAAGKTEQAKELQQKLYGLGLYWKDGRTNYYRQEAFDNWWKDYQKKAGK